jgi:hypothetical protein
MFPAPERVSIGEYVLSSRATKPLSFASASKCIIRSAQVAPLKSLRSVFSFRARGAGTRKRASVAPRLRLGQFGIVPRFRISGIVALTKRVRT